MNRAKCIEGGCEGVVGVLWPVAIELNMFGQKLLAYPCNSCGRLYKENDVLLFSRSGCAAFVRGEVGVLRDASGREVDTFSFYTVGTMEKADEVARKNSPCIIIK